MRETTFGFIVCNFFILAVIWLSALSKKSINECIACEETMMICKESHLRNGHTVDLRS